MQGLACAPPRRSAARGAWREAGFYQEDVANLSQRVTDKHVRGEITIPVASDVMLVGGVGYEHVQISARNAIYDANGNPELDSRGRYVTDYSQPRQIAYDTQGLIWDAGVVWHPSPRTHLEAHVGRRYGQIGGYGFFNWQPNDHSSFDLAVYQGITGLAARSPARCSACRPISAPCAIDHRHPVELRFLKRERRLHGRFARLGQFRAVSQPRGDGALSVALPPLAGGGGRRLRPAPVHHRPEHRAGRSERQELISITGQTPSWAISLPNSPTCAPRWMSITTRAD
jgi:hypothetical protein